MSKLPYSIFYYYKRIFLSISLSYGIVALSKSPMFFRECTNESINNPFEKLEPEDERGYWISFRDVSLFILDSSLDVDNWS